MKSYTRPKKTINRLNLFLGAGFVLFILFLLLGAHQMLMEIKNVAQGQQKLILILAEANKKPEISESIDNEEFTGGYVSKVDFIKFRNETTRNNRILRREIQRIQTRLKMKQLDLKGN